MSSQSSHHPQEVLLAQFSLYVHKGGLKPDSFHYQSANVKVHSVQVEFRDISYKFFVNVDPANQHMRIAKDRVSGGLQQQSEVTVIAEVY